MKETDCLEGFVRLYSLACCRYMDMYRCVSVLDYSVSSLPADSHPLAGCESVNQAELKKPIPLPSQTGQVMYSPATVNALRSHTVHVSHPSQPSPSPPLWLS